MTTAAPGAPDDVPARRPRRWPRRLLIGVNIFAVVCVLAAAGGYAYLHFRLGQIRKVTVGGETTVDTGQPMTILVAGSDSRAGESAAAASHFGSASAVGGQRSDVIILVHLDPGTGSASMLSIPRDTLVTLAGAMGRNKINVAFDKGPTELVETINQDFGIQINHVVQVSFSGVMEIDNSVGGVCMNFPYPARDGSPSGYGNESGLDIATAGPHTLNGDQALALLRSRYFQYYKNGEWRAEGTGDLGRIIRQHSFLRALASKALHKALSNPITANALAGDAVHDVTVDSALSSNDILRLVADMRHVHPSSVPSWTLPTEAVAGYEGYGDVLLPQPTQDQAVIQQWITYNANPPKPPTAKGRKRTTSTTLAPGRITVAVRNGSGRAHQAAAAAGGLRSVGFSVSDTGDAPTFTYTTSEVLYGKGGQAAAKTLAGFVLGGVVQHEDLTLAPGAVELITGSQYTGIAGAPAGAVTTTTTTTLPPVAAGAETGTTAVPPWDPLPCG